MAFQCIMVGASAAAAQRRGGAGGGDDAHFLSTLLHFCDFSAPVRSGVNLHVKRRDRVLPSLIEAKKMSRGGSCVAAVVTATMAASITTAPRWGWWTAGASCAASSVTTADMVPSPLLRGVGGGLHRNKNQYE